MRALGWKRSVSRVMVAGLSQGGHTRERTTNMDIGEAFDAYETRFRQMFGEKPAGSYVKFGSHLVSRLSIDEFRERMDAYFSVHRDIRRVLKSGSTISDALTLEFRERAAWLVIQAPDPLEMFSGEVGDPEVEVTRRDLPCPKDRRVR